MGVKKDSCQSSWRGVALLTPLILLVVVVTTGCTKPMARAVHVKPKASAPVTPEATPPQNPGFAITSGGTFNSTTSTGLQLRSSIRQIGNPVVTQNSTGITLFSGLQGVVRKQR